MGIFDFLRRPPKVERKSYPAAVMNLSFNGPAKWSQYDNAEALEAYRKSVYLYDCLRLRSDNISSVPWIVEQRIGGEWETTETHELAMLLAKPNTDFGLMSMMKRSTLWLDLTGDAWGLKVRDGSGRVREWWPLMPDSMEPVLGKPGTGRIVEAWKYRKGSQRTVYPAEDIIHFMYDGPGSVYYGLSPLQAAAQAVDIDQEAANFQKVTIQNHGMPPGLFEGPSDLAQEQYEQAEAYVADHIGPEYSRRPWVLGGFRYQSMGQSPHELDFIESRKMTRVEICSAYAVPPPLVGIYDDATLANIQTSRRIFWLEGLIPVLRGLESQLNMQLASEYGSDVRVTYDISNVEALAEDDMAKIDKAQKLWAMGVPLTEINRLYEIGLNMDAIPGGDVGYLPSGLLPADFDLGMDDQGPDTSTEDAAVTYGEDDTDGA